ncbi:MAM and LDL-receptor class A domain-containing protein 2 [Nymphon striatum]|nr:MAM and LDL-receptor class A domain-containing protein 2 [Nymphon striatum]
MSFSAIAIPSHVDNMEAENCTFDDVEGTNCGWHNFGKGKGWSRQLGSSLPTGRDHSPGKPTGHIMAFIKRLSSGISSQSLISLQFYRHDHSCFRFWYFVSKRNEGQKANVLTVGYNHKQSNHILLTLRGSTDEFWMAAQASIKLNRYVSNSDRTYQIWFKSNIAGTDGIIAVDDTVLFSGTCEKQARNCSFEDGLCTWSNHNPNDTWNVVRAGDVSLQNMPKSDHSIKSSNGHYLLLKPQSDEKTRATLLSMRLESDISETCLKFWKASPGEENGGLVNIYQYDYGSEDKIKLYSSEDVASKWRDVAVPLKLTKNPFYVEIFGELDKNSQNGVAIDDVKFLNQKDELCNFETYKWCGWEHNSSLSSWQRLEASQISLNHDINPGKSSGYPSLGGMGLIDTVALGLYNKPKKPKKTAMNGGKKKTKPEESSHKEDCHMLAWDTHQYYPCTPDVLKSPLLQFCSESCLEIWMFLDKDDDVQVSIAYETNGERNALTFYSGKSALIKARVEARVCSSVFLAANLLKLGDYGFWEVGMFDIPTTEYRIVVEPSSFSSTQCIGLVAVDNIRVTPGKCPKKKANCDFENGLCTWTSSTDSGYWKTVQASTSSLKGSPQKDHSLKTGNGHYLFLSPKAQGSEHGYVNASIFSIYSKPNNPTRCMSLWVVSPASTSSLVVKIVDVLTRNPTIIYTLKKPVNKWTEIKVSIADFDIFTYFEIQGAVKVSSNEGIAVDDIVFTNEYCKYYNNLCIKKLHIDLGKRKKIKGSQKKAEVYAIILHN